MRPVPPNTNLKGFYNRYTLLVWLGIIYAVSLTTVQAGFFTIIYYTYLVFFSGRLFYDYISKKGFINIWIAATLTSGVVYALFASTLSVFPVSGLIIAALAGGALALIAGSATYMPNAPMNLFFFGPFPFKYLAIGLIILDIFSSGSDVQALDSGVSHFAHLLGAATGFGYIYLQQKGYKTDQWFKWFNKSSSPRMKAKKGGKKTHEKPPADDIDYNKKKIEEQKQIDEILDKISKSGYESLTKKEKELLFRQSKD
ncbi:MAG: rhomboid family intramembrane serine protease [Bacteroidales bacterium]|nr:rhomboid family intramembrane serine protease [Bacteroidales bacterium]